MYAFELMSNNFAEIATISVALGIDIISPVLVVEHETLGRDTALNVVKRGEGRVFDFKDGQTTKQKAFQFGVYGDSNDLAQGRSLAGRHRVNGLVEGGGFEGMVFVVHVGDRQTACQKF